MNNLPLKIKLNIKPKITKGVMITNNKTTIILFNKPMNQLKILLVKKGILLLLMFDLFFILRTSLQAHDIKFKDFIF